MLSSSSSSSSENTPHTHKRLHRNRVSSSSSSWSLHLHLIKTMEEVWNDINLTSLNDHHTPSNSNSNYRNVIFQDFLARSPFDPPSSVVVSSDNTSFYGSPSPAPPLVTALSLGSTGPDFQAQAQAQAQAHASSVSSYCTNINSFDALACASVFPCNIGHTRHLAVAHQSDHNFSNNNSSGNVRHKRMIKNRESAARSRARKQAYTNELEQKVDLLSKENERLRKQQEEWCRASGTHKKKNTLYRTSTAPF